MGAAGYKNATAPLVLRTHEQVSAFFDGFDLLEPGLVQAPLWRPDGRRPGPGDLEKIALYAGVGVKVPASSYRRALRAASPAALRRASRARDYHTLRERRASAGAGVQPGGDSRAAQPDWPAVP
jgi:S-adenosyl methyltransferase